ncbi:Uroporphyrin-III C-methyltransferase [Alloalcanivorax dieselolei B5]|uniref:Uroporphyrin-III C-methyltransferase n=2 Tax=Alloalcanivorax TaxID=3020832 RepID=K0CCM6_ALCDB|nr:MULTISPECIES: DUF488 domain-containing protein [Alloalcanivorax]AFT71314.1 Uroporphyrin-III C-methyltransferase [Alloalcanivorax dieselolei B5]MCU5782435.1 hypothetical protein [Alloalcanivorax balearicus MACL04]GGJ94764.1 hypothetical protein GCM10007426_24690 [Alloalcanivorax dieselolei]
MQLPSRIQCKRVYDARDDSDGYRALVDRAWPRGMKKDHVAADHWFRQLAPSTALRKWFGHDPQRWEEFQCRYHEELEANPEPVEALLKTCAGRPLTLLYAARDTEHNNALALKNYLEARLKNSPSR